MAEITPLPYDIIEPVMPPAPPPDFTWACIAGAMAVVLLIAVALIYRRRTRQRRLARRQLEQARRAFVAGVLPEHDAAYAIAEALRGGFGVRQLAATKTSDPRWRAFIERLDSLRYRAGATDTPVAADLFTEAAFWLRGKPPC
jgi:hypothetical protein